MTDPKPQDLADYLASPAGADDLAELQAAMEESEQPELLVKLAALATYRMTPAERAAQRESFAFGNAVMSNPNVTREMVREAIAKEDGMEEKDMKELHLDASEFTRVVDALTLAIERRDAPPMELVEELKNTTFAQEEGKLTLCISPRMRELVQKLLNTDELTRLVESGVIQDGTHIFVLRGEKPIPREVAARVGELWDFDPAFCEMALARADELLDQLSTTHPELTAQASFEWENSWSGTDSNDKPALRVEIAFSEKNEAMLELGEQGYLFEIWYNEDDDGGFRWGCLDVADVQRWLEFDAKRVAFIRDMSERAKCDFIPYPAPPNPHPEKPER